MSDKIKSILGSSLFLIIGVGMYIYTAISDFPIRAKNDVGSGAVPKLVCGVIIVLSVLKIVLTLLDKTVSTEKKVDSNINVKKGIAVIGILAVYCLAIKEIGFPILTPLMLFGEMALLPSRDKKNYWILAVISIAVTAVIFVAFYYGLDLMLPAGLLKALL